MDPNTYRILHVIGAIALCFGLGGVIATGGREGQKASRTYLVLHGVGLLLLLVAGFGNAGKQNIGFPSWVIVKIVCWVVLAALPFLLARGILQRFLALLVAVAAAVIAAWVGLAREIPI